MHYATEKEIEKLDKLAIANGLQIRQMMELAGWHMVPLFEKLKIKRGLNVAIVCGKGNKAGDGLSAGRHLLNHGWKVRVVLLSENMKEDPEHHLKFLRKMNIPIASYSKNKTLSRKYIEDSDVIIDALIGYHLNGPPRGNFKEVIELINNSKNKVVAYDIPSGIDATTGECIDSCISANATLSLAIPKLAFKRKQGKLSSGKIFVADIGIPNFLYDRVHPRSRPAFENFENGLVSVGKK